MQSRVGRGNGRKRRIMYLVYIWLNRKYLEREKKVEREGGRREKIAGKISLGGMRRRG